MLEVRRLSVTELINICFLIDFSFAGYNNNAVSDPNFGWNLGAPAAASYPTMPMPQPPPSPRYDDSEPGVDEIFQAKDAGSESFAHYIVKWVSCFGNSVKVKSDDNQKFWIFICGTW